MRTLTKTVTLIIDQCDNCPHFYLGEYWESPREYCKFHRRDVPYNINDNQFPIPEWCEVDKDNIIEDLKGQIEILKEQLNNAKHQYRLKDFYEV